MSPSDQRVDQISERRQKSLTCSCRRKSGVCRLWTPALIPVSAGSVRARGLSRQTPRPKERAAGARDSVRHQDPLTIGALRGASPLEGVAGDSAVAPAQGKAFPSIIVGFGTKRYAKCKPAQHGDKPAAEPPGDCRRVQLSSEGDIMSKTTNILGVSILWFASF